MHTDYVLESLVNEFKGDPSRLSMYVVERICAKIHLAKCIYASYDGELRKATTSTIVSPAVLVDLLKILLQWNCQHLDYKVLNGLLTARERFHISDHGFCAGLDRQIKELLCSD